MAKLSMPIWPHSISMAITMKQSVKKHTREINILGRRVMPVMHEISRLPGGHKPLNFVHKLADGSTRHVQTYAGPIEIYGDKLMLCIVHDITEQKGWNNNWSTLLTMTR